MQSALPEHVAEPRPDQVLSLEELDALRAWMRRYTAQGIMEAAGSEDVTRAGDRLLFLAWLRATGRIGGRAD